MGCINCILCPEKIKKEKGEIDINETKNIVLRNAE